MNAVPFDTLKFARKLEASGMAANVAVGTAEGAPGEAGAVQSVEKSGPGKG